MFLPSTSFACTVPPSEAIQCFVEFEFFEILVGRRSTAEERLKGLMLTFGRPYATVFRLVQGM